MRTLVLILLCAAMALAEPLVVERIAALEAARQPSGPELQADLKHPDAEGRG